MGKKKQEGNKEPSTEAQDKKHQHSGGVHVSFLLKFGYQLASVVLFAFALSAFYYFLTEKNWKGVIWSLFAVWCLVGLLAALYAHTHYFPPKPEDPNPSPPAQTKGSTMSDKPEDSKPFISQYIGDGSPGASNTIGNVTYNAAPPERHLTSDLRQCLVSSLRQMHSKGHVSFMCVNGDKEGFAFMVELQDVFTEAGFAIPDGTTQAMFPGPNPQGLLIAVRDFASPHPWADALFDVFTKCGLKGIIGANDRNLPEGAAKFIIGVQR